jgi:hypothetical protein
MIPAFSSCFKKNLPENPGFSSPGMNGSPKRRQQKAGEAEVLLA